MMMTIIVTRRQTCFAGDNAESKSVNCLKMNSTVTVTYDCTGAKGTYPHPNYKQNSVADPGLSYGVGQHKSRETMTGHQSITDRR